MENWGGEISEHIADTNFGLLLHDMAQQKGVIVYATDLDGDRLTDLMADAPDFLRAWGQQVLDHVKPGMDMNKLWGEMGFTMKNGKDMTSVMYRIQGEPIYEQTLGSADAMLLRLLAGDESEGGTKQPYDPRIHRQAPALHRGLPEAEASHQALGHEVAGRPQTKKCRPQAARQGLAPAQC